MSKIRWTNGKSIINKILNPDGSITTLDGQMPIDPVAIWKNSSPIINKVLEPDGSIGVLNFGNVGNSEVSKAYVDSRDIYVLEEAKDFAEDTFNPLNDSLDETVSNLNNLELRLDSTDLKLAEVDEQLDNLEAQSTAKWITLNECDTRSRSNLTSISNLNLNKVDKIEGLSLSQENFTTLEKEKLSKLESSKYKGKYTSVELLNEIIGEDGSYAYVDLGVGQDIVEYIWDSSDGVWVKQLGTAATEIPTTIKNKYESNPDTNCFTDLEKLKLNSLNNYDDTSLLISLNNKVDKMTGKQLSSNDYTDLDRYEVSKVATKSDINHTHLEFINYNQTLTGDGNTRTFFIVHNQNKDFVRVLILDSNKKYNLYPEILFLNKNEIQINFLTPLSLNASIFVLVD